MTPDFTHVFAEAGNVRNIIDVVHPATGRSAIMGETLEQIQRRYPSAEVLEFHVWQARKAAMQDAPLSWLDTTQEQYREMHGILPPAYWDVDGFLVGEPDDHHAMNGRPRYRAYIHRNGAYFVSSRPVTVAEYRRLFQ